MRDPACLLFVGLLTVGCNGNPTPDGTGTSAMDVDQDGFSPSEGDCNDADPTIHPDADEVACDNIDNDCNGQIDDGVAGWLQTKAERDSDGDGTPDGAIHFTYRDDGQPLTEAQTYVDPKLAEWEYLITWSYDQDRVTSKVRTGKDPYDETYQTDNEGRITRSEIDEGSDDMLERIVEMEYDERDRVILARTDADADGKVDFVQSWTFEGDRQIGWKTDADADGTWDSRYEEDWTDNRVQQTRTDNDEDADWDLVRTYTYDASGTLVRLDTDSDGDGKTDQVDSYTNNAAGQLLRSESDTDADGKPNAVEERDYNESGHQVAQRNDYEADGEWDALWEGWDHDADGNVGRARSDANADGEWDREWWYTWMQGRQTSIRFDSDGDGVPNTVFEWEYDELLHITHDRYDLQNDAVWDQENWYTWVCGG